VPLAYVIGSAPFFKHEFLVSEDTLIPRADSEVAVEEALAWLKGLAAAATTKRVLDLGTGSGCLLLSVLAEDERLSGVGVDISERALAIARRNAEKLGIARSRVEFVLRCVGVYRGCG